MYIAKIIDRFLSLLPSVKLSISSPVTPCSSVSNMALPPPSVLLRLFPGILRVSKVLGCFLDASKAFDMVDHDILFRTLKYNACSVGSSVFCYQMVYARAVFYLCFCLLCIWMGYWRSCQLLVLVATGVVVKGSGPSLLGRNWLKKIRLDWSSIQAVQITKPHPKLAQLLERRSAVFKETPGINSMTKHTASLVLQPGTRPIFRRLHAMPFAMKAKVRKELDKLEEQGIIQKVDHASWAAQ